MFSYLLQHGGISPRTGTRRAKCLSAEERESISRGLASGASYRAIGRQLGRSASERHCHDRRQKHAVHSALQDQR
ncbi:MAG: helix-turn-helix domain-containing protein [Achromobacter sp.]|uniref:helix-turn-helix domain-containing protein n=1 Tax=Achromobacter sp. TaxID=134375 RepID=UPI003D026E6D